MLGILIKNNNESSFYYVVTAPEENFEVSPKDKLFVITTTYPGGSNLGNINYDEINSDNINQRELEKAFADKGIKIYDVNNNVAKILKRKFHF